MRQVCFAAMLILSFLQEGWMGSWKSACSTRRLRFSKLCNYKRKTQLLTVCLQISVTCYVLKKRSGSKFSLRLKHILKFFMKCLSAFLHSGIVFNQLHQLPYVHYKQHLKRRCTAPDGIAYTCTKATSFSNMVFVAKISINFLSSQVSK